MITGSILTLTTAFIGAATCPLPDPSAGTELDYTNMKGFVLEEGDPRLVQFSPVFLVEDYNETFNRIGTPSARYDDKHREEVFVDPGHPTYYTEVREWQSENHAYTNLIYRVHFEESFSNSKSRDGGKGSNTGTIAIVTLDESGKPVFFNSVQTCGCFHAILPTTFTPEDEYPEGWNRDGVTVYGENLPGLMAYPDDFGPDVRPVVFLRNGNHRTADIQVASLDSIREQYELIPAEAQPMDALKHLKLGDGETSFYFEDGKKKGLVKGAYKRTEGMLLGAWIGDSRVGQDRIYGGEDELPRGFYTTIDPSKKDESDMWDYKSFLELNGWKP